MAGVVEKVNDEIRNKNIDDTQYCRQCEAYARRVERLEAALKKIAPPDTRCWQCYQDGPTHVDHCGWRIAREALKE